MTVSDSVSGPCALCRPTLSSSDSVRAGSRAAGGSLSAQRGPLEFGITYEFAHDCPCVVWETLVPR